MGKDRIDSTALRAEATAYRRYFLWAQIAIAYLFLELAIWAPTLHLRNRWAAILAITMLIFILSDGLSNLPSNHRPSLQRLGLGLPNVSGAAIVLATGLAAAVSIVILVRWAGGQIPANPSWFSHLRSAWGYAIWALFQEFILQSFFFIRFEELNGSSAAVWIASALFAAAHLPNPVLLAAALAGSLFFCEMFRRYRSIYPLAISHALLGLTLALTIPDSLLHHMRVGLGYLRY
jgi:membrane protease YdiL (CAAX protease family)